MMARIRTVKPDLFRHEELFEAEQEEKLPIRVAFIALFTVCDREGRFKWRPRSLKLDCLPYDDVDFSSVLDALLRRSLIDKYEVDGIVYGAIPSWSKHQVINQRESKSTIPEKPIACTKHVHARAYTLEESAMLNGVNLPQALRETVFFNDNCKCARCDSDEDLTVDHIFPQSIGGTHLLTNLRTLCRKCNSARPVQGKALLEDLMIDGLTMDDMESMCTHSTSTCNAQGEGKGKEGKGREGNVCTEQSSVVFKLPLNAKETFHDVTAKHISEFAELYPAVDIEQQLRNMIGWLNANSQRRKTKNGATRFINAWLSREQDKGGKHISTEPSRKAVRKPSFAAKNNFIDGEFERLVQ